MTAEELMRSRYSAFATANADYLRHSWLPANAPRTIHVADARVWTGLTIVRTTAGGPFDNTGTVHFEARFEESDRTGSQSENSLFTRWKGRWVYVGPAPPSH